MFKDFLFVDYFYCNKSNENLRLNRSATFLFDLHTNSNLRNYASSLKSSKITPNSFLGARYRIQL